MSTDQDRIAVPTNGRGPNPLPAPAEEPENGAGEPSEAEMSTAFSPKQLAIGFGIVASLLLLAAGALRRRSRG